MKPSSCAEIALEKQFSIEEIKLINSGDNAEKVDIIVDPSRPFNQDLVLLNWINAHLKNSECPKKINNLGKDLTDSVGLIYLLN